MEKATDQTHVNNFDPSSCKYSKRENSMENLSTVERYFVRYHYAPHMAIALIFCLISPAVIGYSNLDTAQAARVMEMYFSITGMLLFAPLLIPEQDRSIRALIRSKELPLWQLLLVRLATAILVAAIIVLVILSIIKNSGGTIAYGRLFAGSFAEIIFLGSISFLAGSLTNQFILGYMSGFMYYAVNLGASKYLGHFALFQMIRGTYDFIPWMLVLSAAFFIVGTICNEQRS